jgi:hypothetical protein
MFCDVLATCEEDIELGAEAMRAGLAGHPSVRELTPDSLKSPAWHAGMARVVNGKARRHTVWNAHKQHHEAFLAASRADIEAKRAALIATLGQIMEGKGL